MNFTQIGKNDKKLGNKYQEIKFFLPQSLFFGQMNNNQSIEMAWVIFKEDNKFFYFLQNRT